MSSPAEKMGSSEQEPIVLSSPETEHAEALRNASRSPASKAPDEAIQTNEDGQQDDALPAHTTIGASQEYISSPPPGTQLMEYQEPLEELTIEESAARFDEFKTNVWDAGVNETRASVGLPPWDPGAPMSGRKRKATAMAEEENLDGLLDSFEAGDLDTVEQLDQQHAKRRRKMPRLDGRGFQSAQQAGADGRGHGPAQETTQPGRLPHSMWPSIPMLQERPQQQYQQGPSNWRQRSVGDNFAPQSEAQRRYQMHQEALHGVSDREPRTNIGFAGTRQVDRSGSASAQDNHHMFHPQPRYSPNFGRGAPSQGWQVGQNIARQIPLVPTAVAPPPDWGRLQDTAATAAKLPAGALEAVRYAQDAPVLPPPPANNTPRPRPQHTRILAIGGDLVEPTSGHDFKEIYRALYPTLAMLLRTKAQLVDQSRRTWVKLNLRYRDAWDDIKAELEWLLPARGPEKNDEAVQQYIPKRGALRDGWADYVSDWDMPYRGLGTAQARNRWLEYNWNSLEREQEKERVAPIIMSAAFAASPKAQQFRTTTGWLLGAHVQVEWNGSHVIVVDIEKK